MTEEVEVEEPLECINCGSEMIHYESEPEDDEPDGFDECPECGYREP